MISVLSGTNAPLNASYLAKAFYLPFQMRTVAMLETSPGFLFPDRRPLKEMVDDYERKIVLMALELSHWNQRRAASSLGLLPSTLSEKMKRFGLRRVKEEPAERGSSAA